MLIFFIIFGLIFLASGGIGLFYINTANHVASGTALLFRQPGVSELLP